MSNHASLLWGYQIQFECKIPRIITGFEGLVKKESRSYEPILARVKVFTKCKILAKARLMIANSI